MLMFDAVVQTQFGSFFRAFALPNDVKPTTGVAPGSKIEEMNPATGAVDTYRFNGEEWVKIDTNGSPVIPEELPPLPEEDGEYSLLLTITDGVPALTWEAEET